VQELLRLIDDRLDDVGMRMAGGVDGNPGRAIEEQVPIDIFDHRAFAARHHERIAARVGRRDGLAVALDQRLGLGAGELRFDERS
jgi:hypothetical protein